MTFRGRVAPFEQTLLRKCRETRYPPCYHMAGREMSRKKQPKKEQKSKFYGLIHVSTFLYCKGIRVVSNKTKDWALVHKRELLIF